MAEELSISNGLERSTPHERMVSGEVLETILNRFKYYAAKASTGRALENPAAAQAWWEAGKTLGLGTELKVIRDEISSKKAGGYSGQNEISAFIKEYEEGQNPPAYSTWEWSKESATETK